MSGKTRKSVKKGCPNGLMARSIAAEDRVSDRLEKAFTPALRGKSGHILRKAPKVPRNGPCPCGSPRKAKLCHPDWPVDWAGESP